MVLFVLSAAATTQIYTLSLHDALPISIAEVAGSNRSNDVEEPDRRESPAPNLGRKAAIRSEEHTSELQSRRDIVCRLLLEKKNRIEYCAVPAANILGTEGVGYHLFTSS